MDITTNRRRDAGGYVKRLGRNNNLSLAHVLTANGNLTRNKGQLNSSSFSQQDLFASKTVLCS